MNLISWIKSNYPGQEYLVKNAFSLGRELYEKYMLNDHKNLPSGVYYALSQGRVTQLLFYKVPLADFSNVNDRNDIKSISIVDASKTENILLNILKRCASLASLHLSGAEISELPAEIGLLHNLRSLNLHGTKISKLPAEIGQLQNLSSLDLSWTNISKLPAEIGQLQNLSSLNLSRAEISELPAEIGQLQNLRSLDLSETNISELPAEIGQLQNLNSLDLRRADISELPAEIGQLQGLDSLPLSGTKISELPAEIGQLQGLDSLDLSWTNISKLPAEIGQLQNLSSLNLSGTKISELLAEIGQLQNLNSLDLRRAEISELPAEIGQLQNLSSLNLSWTKIGKLPAEIGQLKDLRYLDLSRSAIRLLDDRIYSLPLKSLNLSGLKLETISSKILNLKLAFVFEEQHYKFVGIDLFQTEICETGVSIFKRPRKEIERFLKELEAGKTFLNESRVIFIGDGGAGKSSIIHRITHDEFTGEIKETRGILIQDWIIEEGSQPSKISFWDFGGQTIMHSMHKFFLGERCLYVIVLDGRRDDSPDYWLDIIAQYGTKSSVMIVMNKIDQNSYADIDRNKLIRHYGKMFLHMRFLRISCKSSVGFSGFKQALCDEVKKLETRKKAFPAKWCAVKETLSQMKETYISEKDYRKICENNNINDKLSQDTLLNLINDLGICFSYQSEGNVGCVNEMKILCPEWITNGVYKIITSEVAKKCNGFLNKDSITKILENEDDLHPAYHNTERDFILGMLHDFKLSYTVDDSEFIPMLTRESEPELAEPVNTLHLQIEYEKPLPVPFFYNFVVRMKSDVIVAQTWRSGTALKNFSYDSNALVRYGRTRNTIDILVSGKDKSLYLAQIRSIFLSTQSKLEVKYEEYVYYDQNGRPARLKLGRIRKMLNQGFREDFADDIEERVDLYDVLSLYSTQAMIDSLKQELNQKDNELISLQAKVRRDKESPPYTNITINNLNQPQFNTASDQATLNGSQNNGINIAELEYLIKEVQNSIPTNLAAEDSEEIMKNLDVIKAELDQPQPRKSILNKVLSGLKAIKDTTEFAAAVTALAQFIHSVI